MHQHVVVEFGVYPGLRVVPDIAEITDHSQFIENHRLQPDYSGCIVAMQMTAFACVVEQAVAIAEVDLFGNGVHGRIQW